MAMQVMALASIKGFTQAVRAIYIVPEFYSKQQQLKSFS